MICIKNSLRHCNNILSVANHWQKTALQNCSESPITEAAIMMHHGCALCTNNATTEIKTQPNYTEMYNGNLTKSLCWPVHTGIWVRLWWQLQLQCHSVWILLTELVTKFEYLPENNHIISSKLIVHSFPICTAHNDCRKGIAIIVAKQLHNDNFDRKYYPMLDMIYTSSITCCHAHCLHIIHVDPTPSIPNLMPFIHHITDATTLNTSQQWLPSGRQAGRQTHTTLHIVRNYSINMCLLPILTACLNE